MDPRSSIQPPICRQPPTLAAIAVGAVIAAALPRLAAADGRRLGFDAFATVSLASALTFPADGYGPDGAGHGELGAGGSASYRLGRFFELGLGLRYDVCCHWGDTLHLVAVPVTAALVIPIDARRELRLGAGLGPELGVFPDFHDGTEGGAALQVLGGGAEATLGFVQRVHPSGLGLLLQAGIRGGVLDERNADPDGYLHNGGVIYAQWLFVRAGASWR